MIIDPINKYFNFLVTDFGFMSPITYNYVREIHTDYIKEDIIIMITYEGSYCCGIIKLKSIDYELLAGKKRSVDIDKNIERYYPLSMLDPKKRLYNSVSNDNFPDKDLWYCSKLIKNNPEILQGDLTKFSFTYRLLKKIGLR